MLPHDWPCWCAARRRKRRFVSGRRVGTLLLQPWVYIRDGSEERGVERRLEGGTEGGRVTPEAVPSPMHGDRRGNMHRKQFSTRRRRAGYTGRVWDRGTQTWIGRGSNMDGPTCATNGAGMAWRTAAEQPWQHGKCFVAGCWRLPSIQPAIHPSSAGFVWICAVRFLPVVLGCAGAAIAQDRCIGQDHCICRIVAYSRRRGDHGNPAVDG